MEQRTVETEQAADAIRRDDAYARLVEREVEHALPRALATGALRRRDLMEEGAFAVVEARSRFAGWGMDEPSWVLVRVHLRITSLVAAVEDLVTSLEGDPPLVDAT